VFSPRKLLVVDDESNARNALAELLRDEGFEVETANDGFDALGKVARFHPHVVITDLDMPGLDGVELVVRVRTAVDPPSVIGITSFGESTRAVFALRAGATDYLTKPIRFDELLAVLATAIRMHDMEREIAWHREREGSARLGRLRRYHAGQPRTRMTPKPTSSSASTALMRPSIDARRRKRSDDSEVGSRSSSATARGPIV